MFTTAKSRAKKKGQPPGTLTYTGSHYKDTPTVTITTYNNETINEVKLTSLDQYKVDPAFTGITWIDIKGLHDVTLIATVANLFQLHPLTVEDILNVGQRPKVEEFENYTYVAAKMLRWREKRGTFSVSPLNLIMGDKYVLSFHEDTGGLFEAIHTRLASSPNQRLRQQGSDYLLYRLLDAVVDEYFVVLEALSEKIEYLEDKVIANPTPQIAGNIYRLKRQLLVLRKVAWPMREAIGHLLHSEDDLITKFTSVYFRDVYDHTIQGLDTIDSYRDMLAGLLDMYLSSLTNRMNEIMKTLTIITTIFIPITAIASIYGMNFSELPGLRWEYGYFVALVAMLGTAIGMLLYFKYKKWI